MRDEGDRWWHDPLACFIALWVVTSAIVTVILAIKGQP